MMPTEQADRSTRVYSAVGIGRELRTSNFLLALMAAAAEHYRNEAEDRIEELEGAAEIVSEEFEGDCWKAVRTLLERVGWTDFSGGVTAQDACEIIGDAIHESRSQAQALTAERDGLREGVKQRSDDWEPAAAQCGEEVNLWAVILYPGSRVSDIGIGGVKVQVPNDALKISRALSALPNPTTGAE